jgi:hypothetical protein
VYYAAGRKGAEPKDQNSTAHIGLYYVSRWSGEDSARYFAKLYAAGLRPRYTALQRLPQDPVNPGLDRYTSADGPIFIQQKGNVVVAAESFDSETADKLIQLGLKQAEEGLAENEKPQPRFPAVSHGSPAATSSAPSAEHR